MHCIITDGQDSLTGCDEYSKSTRKPQRDHEQHVQNERDQREYVRKLFMCLQKVITTCTTNTVPEENGRKEEQASLASKKQVLGNAIKLVHILQAREIDLKAEKRILVERRSSLAEHYLNLKSDQDIPICRAFVQSQNEEQYIQDCLSKNYTGCFYPRVRLLDISNVSKFTISSKECEGTKVGQHRKSHKVMRADKGRYWLIRNATSIGNIRNLSFSRITDSKDNNACNKVLGDKSSALKVNLQKDIQAIHHKPFSCTLCEKSFSTKSNLKAHIAYVHHKTAFSCTLCDKLFSEKGTVAKHVNAVHLKLKPFSCTLCDKSFVVKSKLARHVNLIHHNLRPFSCTLCDKSFSQNCKLMEHIRRHNGEKLYKCTLCEKRFYNKDSLNKLKPFTCTFCSRSFAVKRNMLDHVKTHTKTKEFICSICEKQFVFKRNLNRHIDLVHKYSALTAALRCPKCKRYYGKDKLEQHIMSCEHDAKTHSHSDSIPKQDATGTCYDISICMFRL